MTPLILGKFISDECFDEDCRVGYTFISLIKAFAFVARSIQRGYGHIALRFYY